MTTGGEEPSLRDLLARTIDNAKAYAKAEIAVVKTIATVRMSQAAPAIGMVVAAIFLLQSALTVLLAALGMTLAIWIGAAGGLAIAALLGLAIAGLLAWMAIKRLKALGS